MNAIEIKGGSEKQKAWATDIAGKWVASFDRKIEDTKARPDEDGVAWYVDVMEVLKESFIRDVNKMTARQIIDIRNNGNPAEGLIRETYKKDKACLVAMVKTVRSAS